MYRAAFFGHKEVAELLIAEGAEVNVKNNRKVTPLHIAARRDHKEVAEVLITKGANMNAKNLNGWTPLFNATSEGHMKTAELLIAEGANVNAKEAEGRTRQGRTPLDWAIFFNKTEIADLLRKHGGKTKKELEAADN